MFNVVVKEGDDVRHKSESKAFNTISTAAMLRGLGMDNLSLRIDSDGDNVIFEGTVADGISMLEKSTVKNGDVVGEFKRFTEFMMMHSSLRGAIVSFVWEENTPDGGTGTSGYGYAMCSESATAGDIVKLDNVNSANRDKFISAVGVPTDTGSEDGKVVIPTREEVERLK